MFPWDDGDALEQEAEENRKRWAKKRTTRPNPIPGELPLHVHPQAREVAKYCTPNTAPHCDARVLHEPGDCAFCDNSPDWQDYRIIAGIKFTGQQVTVGDDWSTPCPSDFHRGTGGAHVWPGNTPKGYGFESLEEADTQVEDSKNSEKATGGIPAQVDDTPRSSPRDRTARIAREFSLWWKDITGWWGR